MALDSKLCNSCSFVIIYGLIFDFHIHIWPFSYQKSLKFGLCVSFFSLRCSGFLLYVPLKFNVCTFFPIVPALTSVWLVQWVFSVCGDDSAGKYDCCKYSSNSSPLSLLPH
jgi:hypothetical protein